eukprot:2434661-Ditylum_brightwellii.AAC.1
MALGLREEMVFIASASIGAIALYAENQHASTAMTGGTSPLHRQACESLEDNEPWGAVISAKEECQIHCCHGLIIGALHVAEGAKHAVNVKGHGMGLGDGFLMEGGVLVTVGCCCMSNEWSRELVVVDGSDKVLRMKRASDMLPYRQAFSGYEA